MSGVDFIAYLTATGEIMWTGTVPEGMMANQANAEMGIGVKPGTADTVTQYIDITDGYQIKDKQALPFSQDKVSITADGVDTVTWSGMPAGVVVIWPDGAVDTDADGVVQFAVDTPGTYKFTFRAFPYLDLEISLEANAVA